MSSLVPIGLRDCLGNQICVGDKVKFFMPDMTSAIHRVKVAHTTGGLGYAFDGAPDGVIADALCFFTIPDGLAPELPDKMRKRTCASCLFMVKLGIGIAGDLALCLCPERDGTELLETYTYPDTEACPSHMTRMEYADEYLGEPDVDDADDDDLDEEEEEDV